MMMVCYFVWLSWKFCFKVWVSSMVMIVDSVKWIISVVRGGVVSMMMCVVVKVEDYISVKLKFIRMVLKFMCCFFLCFCCFWVNR